MWGMFCNRWFTLIQLLRLYHSYHLPENNDWYKMLSVVMDIITSLGSVLMKVELWWQEVLFFFHKEGAVARENPGSFSFFPFFFLLLNLIFQSCCGRVLVSLSCCTAAANRPNHLTHINPDSRTHRLFILTLTLWLLLILWWKGKKCVKVILPPPFILLTDK